VGRRRRVCGRVSTRTHSEPADFTWWATGKTSSLNW
jgi:hypothetical protein